MEEEIVLRRLTYMMRSYATPICGMISGKVKRLNKMEPGLVQGVAIWLCIIVFVGGFLRLKISPDTALALKAKLNSEFPGVEFSIERNKWHSVIVDWTDGPENNQVTPIVRGYACGQTIRYTSTEESGKEGVCLNVFHEAWPCPMMRRGS